MTRTRAGLLAGLILAAGSASAAHAQVTEGNFQLRTTGDLVALCSPPPEDRLLTAAANFCHGFASGSYRVFAEMEQARRGPKLICLPTPTPTPAPTRTSAIAEFVVWAQASPDRMSLSPTDGLLGFVRQHYACPRG